MSRSKILIVASLATALVVAFGLGYWLLDGSAAGTSESATTFVGSETCAGCHQTEADLWHKSQHRLAMQHATENSVLGEFSDTSFDYYGVHSRFFRRINA
jgi:cytochrome c553